ncbi:hypothetical protein OUZ56_015661 [Daphnia magna]|uniref:Uncharacterized protein n=1 Tax=Daphnia magna TaxID=35525 RepID=A0ABR0ANH1_9CRUS|nr:hypothetical protein OUZ56_015661 [Daphnia magna]
MANLAIGGDKTVVSSLEVKGDAATHRLFLENQASTIRLSYKWHANGKGAHIFHLVGKSKAAYKRTKVCKYLENGFVKPDWLASRPFPHHGVQHCGITKS